MSSQGIRHEVPAEVLWVEKLCGEKVEYGELCIGELRFTEMKHAWTQGTSVMVVDSGPQYVHQCTRCERVVRLEDRYPRFELWCEMRQRRRVIG